MMLVTVIGAVAANPVPPLEAMVLVVLTHAPLMTPNTVTVMVQVAPAAKVPPVRLTAFVLLTAVTTPPQLLTTAGGFEITRPAGKVSACTSTGKTELVCTPAITPVTLTVTVHEPAAAKGIPCRSRLLLWPPHQGTWSTGH